MIDVIVHLFLAAFFTVGIRWVQIRKQYNIFSVGAVNYLAAYILGLAMLLLYWRSSSIAVPSDFRSAIPTFLTGAGLGIGYLVAFFLLLRTLQLRGVAIANALTRLAVLIPITLAIVIWGERPGAIQWMGIAVSLAAVFLMNAPKRAGVRSSSGIGTWMIPILLFLVAGGSFTAQEIFNHLDKPEQQALFVVCSFGVTAIGAMVILIVRNHMPSIPELIVAVLLGTANALQVLFLLRALDRLSSFLVFAVSGAGGVICTVVIARVVLGERPSGVQALGIAAATVALVLLQVR